MYITPENITTIDFSQKTDLTPYLNTIVRSAENGFHYLVITKQEYKETPKDYKGTLENGDKSILAMVDRQTQLVRAKLI